MNQNLEDMLCMYVMDQHKNWEEFLPLVEFTYKKSYQSTIKMVTLDFPYGRPCETPLIGDRLEDRVLVEPEEIQEMEYQMKSIIKGVKETWYRKKSYVDAHRVDCSYEVGDRVSL
jgi:hypothetical protein